jgi:mannose-6-phosphate isomerase-like protein (cupin superfamily)
MPEVDARLARENLLRKYDPNTKANLIKLKKELIKSKVKGLSNDPDQSIQSIDIMKRTLEILGHGITEMDIIIHILHNLPEEYETLIKLLENDLESDTAALERVKEKLRAKFNRINRSQTLLLNRSEKALIKREKGKRYKALCSHCGIYEHRGIECRRRAANNSIVKGKKGIKSDFFPGPCFICHQAGHKALNFPSKVNSENTIVSQNSEIALMSTDHHIDNSQYWIGDSGATSHVVCSEIGMFETKVSNQSVIVRYRQSHQIKNTGKLRVKFEDKNKEVTHILLEEVKYIPEMKVNLFSLPFVLQKGASVKSEGKSLVTKRKTKKFIFLTRFQWKQVSSWRQKLSQQTKMG